VDDFENHMVVAKERFKIDIQNRMTSINKYLEDRITSSSSSRYAKISKNNEIESERNEFERVLVSLNKSNDY
jgi:hypothetical protein